MLTTSWVISASIGEPRVRAPYCVGSSRIRPIENIVRVDELLAAFWLAITELIEREEDEHEADRAPGVTGQQVLPGVAVTGADEAGHLLRAESDGAGVGVEDVEERRSRGRRR